MTPSSASLASASFTGLAIFVKTPGLSPVKTRLSRGAGAEFSQEFYKLSVNATKSVVLAAHTLGYVKAHWAIAEESLPLAHPWQHLPILHQGAGSLGERLDKVYSSLQEIFGSAILIGADSPQITLHHLIAAISAIDSRPSACDFAVGRARDGGFYLFAGKRPIPRDVWLRVPYSSNDTAEKLVVELSKLGSVYELSTLSDVDEITDLPELLNDFAKKEEWTLEQVQLRDWIIKNFSRMNMAGAMK